MSSKRRQILVLGSRGFIGQHLFAYHRLCRSTGFDLVLFERPSDMDLTSISGRRKFLATVDYSEYLLLSWSQTGTQSYDQGELHERWITATRDLVDAWDQRGERCWLVGAGTNQEANRDNSNYARSKWQIRETFNSKWSERHAFIDLPYIYSLPHGRPRLIADATKAMDASSNFVPKNPGMQHDYLEIGDVCSQLCLHLESADVGFKSVTSGRRVSNQALIDYALSKSQSTDPVRCVCKWADRVPPDRELGFTQEMHIFSSRVSDDPTN